MTYTAFSGARRLGTGSLAEAAVLAQGAEAALVFDNETGRVVDLDPREIAPTDAKRTAGRPKLGVVAREVTLLPRHWEWLQEQPGGASIALRRLVEEARKSGRDGARKRGEAFHRFATAMAGDLPGYEEALRAFYAGDAARLARHTEAWPPDVRDHARRLAAMPASAASA